MAGTDRATTIATRGDPRLERASAAGTSERFVRIASVRTPRNGRESDRATAVRIHFGALRFDGPTTVLLPTRIPLAPGRIVLFVGPSGAGKTSALDAIERHFAGGCRVDRAQFPLDAAIVDAVAPWGDLSEAVAALTCCGLGEPRLWLRRFDELSDGERFRARLARALAIHARGPAAAPLLCDEFCSSLHRRVAKAVSFNVRKLVTRMGVSLVAASSNDDILADSQPDTVVRLAGTGRVQVEQRGVPRCRPVSFRRRRRVEPGRKRDYDDFAAMHYRPADELGFVDKVFVLRDRNDAAPLGAVVYAHGPLELALRNRATGGVFAGRPRELNRRMRIIRRLVVHPDVRGCGLGHYLVRKTLPLVGTEFVECLATMGAFNPVFERAGMRRIGQYEIAPQCRKALAELAEFGVDMMARDFPLQVCRSSAVRRIVVALVYDWYARTTGGGAGRVRRQSPAFLARTFRAVVASRPVYYLWRRRNDW